MTSRYRREPSTTISKLLYEMHENENEGNGIKIKFSHVDYECAHSNSLHFRISYNNVST